MRQLRSYTNRACFLDRGAEDRQEGLEGKRMREREKRKREKKAHTHTHTKQIGADVFLLFRFLLSH
jgi:hypothetical protein